MQNPYVIRRFVSPSALKITHSIPRRPFLEGAGRTFIASDRSHQSPISVGRIYLAHGSRPRWVWGVYGASGRPYGHAPAIESALSAFKVAYLTWKGTGEPPG